MIILDHVLKPDIGPVVLGNMIKLKDILSEKFDSNFLSWFNGSVVIDSSGNPSQMYHGTHAKKNFSIFNTELRGAWFTANPKEAAAYAGGGDASSFKKYGRTIPVFLSIKNPKKFTLDEFDGFIDTWVRYNSYKKEMANIKKKAISDGFDGLYLQGTIRERDIYVAFYQNQIKNAITLNELDYPLAGKEDLQTYGGMDGWKGKVVYMSPDKFLRLAAPLPDWAINKEGLKKIEDRMKGQLPLDFCVLEVNMKTRTVTGHEGRHRCIAAKKLGIEKVPVLIYTGSSFDRVPQWNQSTHDDIDKADFNPQLKEEESVSSTFKMYHGGSRWSYLPDDIQPGKKNHYEAGVGIYFTNSYNTARKYAKGNKVVHLVEIDKQFKDIENVRVTIEKITEFVKSVPQLSSKKEIITDITSYSTRVGKTEIPLSVLNNLVVNYQAARGSSGVSLAKFFTDSGADGSIQKQSGDEIWLVVFNPKILKSVKVVNPTEINSDSQFMLKNPPISETYSDEDEDLKLAAAERYFSVGQDEDVGNNYCWIWDGSFIKAKKGGSHGINFTHDVADRNFKGWYDVDKHLVSIVFPERERRKLTVEPSIEDVPQNLYTALQKKFSLSLTDNDFRVFENNSTLSSFSEKDKNERTEYQSFLKKNNGDWKKSSTQYAKLKGRKSDDIFGERSRLEKFIKLTFDFSKFDSKDWQNYWLLSQHCDFDREFQKKSLKIIEKFLGNSSEEFRYLSDRISCASSGVQKHGTQNICKSDSSIEERVNDLTIESSDDDYDVSADFMQRRDEELSYLCRSLKNSGGKGRVSWKTIPATLLKRVWLQFGKYNRINSNDLDKISDQIMTNIARLRASTEMMGHSQIGKDEIEAETGIEFTDEEWENWMSSYFTDLGGSWLLSDFGLPKLEKIYPAIFNAKTDEEKLYACDKALNVIHQRNDLASMFVEGGSKTLMLIANQGGYTSDEQLSEGLNDTYKEFYDLKESIDNAWFDTNSFKTFKKSVKERYKIAQQDGTIQTLEGPVNYKAGHYIMTGPKGEQYPITPETFHGMKDDSGNGVCIPKKIIKLAKLADHDGVIHTNWGKLIYTANNDYIVKHGPNNFGVVKKDIFDQTYDKT